MKTSIVIFVALLFSACQQSSDGMRFGSLATESSAMEKESDYAFNLTVDEGASASTPMPAKPTLVKQENRKIIRTADIHIEVDDYAASIIQLGELTKQFQAVITNESERKWDYRVENQLTIRVVPDKMDALIKEVEKMALVVSSKQIKAEDVTRQYVDLESRLASKRAVVERYQAILKTAQSIPDILEVEENLRKVIEEIESSETQLRYLKNQVNQSTINLMLYEQLRVPVSKGKSFWKRVGNAFVNGWEVLQEFVIGLLSIWPFLFLGGGIFFLIRRRWKRKKVA